MDVFDLYAKLSLDSKDYDRSLQNASDAAEQWKTKMVMAAKAVGSAVSGAISGISSIVDGSVKAFSNFQQLEGGIQTLFGTQGKSFEEWSKSFSESSDSMQDYIDVARKVINGDFGAGEKRKDLLTQAGYDPETVQQMVNNLINGVDVASDISAEKITANMQTAEEKYASLQRAEEAVMKNSQNAWLTANMSANDYMEKAVNYATALTQSLGGDTEKAASVVDMAIGDMADNVNKMGTSMDMVENAYRGFMMGNYKMLDNLHLGYQGTKEEMQRLLKDAEKVTGKKYDLSNLADVFEAVHVIQEELGITGTTVEESQKTIEGSTKMMKAAWQNMLTAMVKGDDWFDESLNNLVDSVATWAENIMPAVTSAMEGFAALVGRIVPYIAQKLPGLVQELLPSFVKAISDILDGILDAIPELIKVIKDVVPIITNELNNLIPDLITFILDGVPMLIDAGITLLTSLVQGMADNVSTVVPQLTQGIIDLVDNISSIVSGGGVGLASAAMTLLSNLADEMVKAVPSMLTQITQLVQDLTVSIGNAANGENGNFLTTATTILTNLVNGLMESIPTLVPQLTEAVAEFITQFASIASSNATDFTNTAISILNSLITSLGDSGTISKVMTDITTAVMAIIDAIINVITNLDITTFADACASLIGQLADGLVSAIDVITDKLPELITGIVAWLTNPENITGLFEAAVTIGGKLISKVPEIIESLTSALWGIVTGVAKYFTDNGDEILKGFKDGFASIGTTISELWENDIKPAFEDLGKHFIDWFTQFEWGQTIVDFVNNIVSAFTDLWGKVKESFEGGEGFKAKIKNFFSNFDWGITFTVFVNNIKNSFIKLWDNVKDAFTGDNGFFGKIKGWFSEFDLTQTITGFIDKIKSAIDGAWDSFKEWFNGKISGLFSGIQVPNWIKKLFGKGEGNAEDMTQMGAEDEQLVDMPENMLTLDYSNLEPIPDETLASYQALADAINSINTAISGGGEEGDGLGLNSALSGLPALMGNVLSSATELADYLSGGLVTGIQGLMKILCLTSTDEEGNTQAGGGNTLYNALGSVYGLFTDILATSERLAAHWTNEFISASEQMRREAGHATSVVKGLGTAAQSAAQQFGALAQQIYGVIDAYLELNSVRGSSRGGRATGKPFESAKAEGGPVKAGSTYLVGERGPEMFSPSRAGYITSNNDLMARKQEIHVSVNFNGEVIGDEKTISAYVNRAAKRAIQEEVYAAS